MLQLFNGIMDLVRLYGGIDQNADIVQAYADDLNGVLQAESVPDEDVLVEKTEDEDGKIGRNRLGCGHGSARLELQADLESRENVSVRVR